MRWVLLLLSSLSLTGCVSYTNEFHHAAPQKVAVVIGYNITGGKSLDPKLNTAAVAAGYLGAFSLPALLAQSAFLAYYVLNPGDNVTMVDEFNLAVYQNLETALVAKGYEATLLKTMPISFSRWRNADAEKPKTYFARIMKNYQLGEAELQASGVDAVLYLEYCISANVMDIEELQSMNAVDLKVDFVVRNVMAFSLPPANKVIFHHKESDMANVERWDFQQTITAVTDLEGWPQRQQ